MILFFPEERDYSIIGWDYVERASLNFCGLILTKFEIRATEIESIGVSNLFVISPHSLLLTPHS